MLDADQLRQLAGVEHLLDDVAAADQLGVDIELRERAPIGDLPSDLAKRIEQRQHVDRAVLHPELLEHPHEAHREAAAGHLGCSLHEQQDPVFAQQSLDLLLQLRIGWHPHSP